MKGEEHTTVEILVDRIEDETDLALCLVIPCPDGKNRHTWIPKSQIISEDWPNKTIEILEWVAIEKDLV